MSMEIRVGISDYKVAKSPHKIMTLGLGSCVGIAIYDKVNEIGGLSHIMLPDSSFFHGDIKPEKFADLAIPKMVEEITNGNNRRNNLVAKIAGGASMFNFSDNVNGNIGYRNVVAVEEKLKELGISILAKDVGGNMGRTMIVDLETFIVNIRMVNREIITL